MCTSQSAEQGLISVPIRHGKKFETNKNLSFFLTQDLKEWETIVLAGHRMLNSLYMCVHDTLGSFFVVIEVRSGILDWRYISGHKTQFCRGL